MIYYGSGWQGDYNGYHYILGAGTVSPTADQAADLSTWPKLGGVVLEQGPTENAASDSAPGIPLLLNMPRTPGPLRVVGVQLPDITVAGPAGDQFKVNIVASTVTSN